MLFRDLVLDEGEVGLCRRILDGGTFFRPGQGRFLEGVSGFLHGGHGFFRNPGDLAHGRTAHGRASRGNKHSTQEKS
jgi:hypothetical protein